VTSYIVFEQKTTEKIKVSPERSYEMVIHNVKNEPKSVFLAKKEIKYQFDKNAKTLTIITNIKQTIEEIKINW
jgi:hypothetical protein